MVRKVLIAIAGMVLLVACGTAPVNNIAPTQTRTAELAQLATAQAPKEPVVVVLATPTPTPSPTPDNAARAYLAGMHNGLTKIGDSAQSYMLHCQEPSACQSAYDQYYPVFQQATSDLLAIPVPTSCNKLASLVNDYTLKVSDYFIFTRAAANDGSDFTTFLRVGNERLERMITSLKAVNTERQTGSCQP